MSAIDIDIDNDHNETGYGTRNNSSSRTNQNKSNIWKFWKKNKKEVEGEIGIEIEREVKISEHRMELDDVCALHETDSTLGLTEEEASVRLARDGPNSFSPPKQTGWWVLYLKEMRSGFALLLWFPSIASFISYAINKDLQDIYLGIVLALTVLLTGSFSYYQQANIDKIFKSFQNMDPPETTVIRYGMRKQIPSDQIVIGDLVYCQRGDTVPADIRIVMSENMKVDNSSLTGDSDPVTRSPNIGLQNPLEASNLAFFSTDCVDGSGYGIVVATGDRTLMANIARLVSKTKNEKTPIAKEINRFVKIITIISVFTAILFFCIAIGFGSNLFQSYILMIGITFGNVPEGLLPASTVALTLTAKRLASKNCLVKHLEDVVTLGLTSIICTDKTGTLTQNRMTVEHIWFGTHILKVSHTREQVEQQMRPMSNSWEAYKRCAVLCSRSEFTDDNPDVMKRGCFGDPSEIAILRFMESVEGSVHQYRSQFPKVAEKPFNAVNKYQYSIHKSTDDGPGSNLFLVMKGAPERIIKLCNTVIGKDGQTTQMDSQFKYRFKETCHELGSLGERVLALCDHDFTQFPVNHKFNLEERNDFELHNFRFLGLIAMIDPPRPSVPGAVAKCRNSGIKIIMVTGDHPITAKAIAQQVGIFSESSRKSPRITLPSFENTQSIVVHGDYLSTLSDPELREILISYGEIVFARTSPQQKLRIVENCQALGQIVAFSGDGVNDSPTLKKADIGIAMGISGSEVSKQAANIILLDDNFATIAVGVEEGRHIFDNMKKIVSYMIVGSVTTLYPFLVYVAFGIPLAIDTITVLLICLGTDMIPAVALAYERAEPDIMSSKPRNTQKNPKTDKLVTSNLLMRSYFWVGAIASVAGFNGYFCALYFEGFKPHMLWNKREQWVDKNFTMFRYGPHHPWIGEPMEPINYEERQELLIIAQSAYFISVIVVQWIDVIVNKTRRLSIFSQGMGNWVLNWSLVFETGLAVLLCYTPGLKTALKLSPVIGQVWVSAVPFFFYILIFEELRKLIIRNWPEQSFLAKELSV